MKKGILALYLLIIAVMVGMELALGALSAPVIFFEQNFIGKDLLSHFESGLIMTTIFIRYDFVLATFIFVVMIYEFVSYYFGSKDKLNVIIASFNIVFACAFLYFSLEIVTLQQQGSSILQDPYFQQIHFLSELDMKALVIAQAALFLRRFLKHL